MAQGSRLRRGASESVLQDCVLRFHGLHSRQSQVLKAAQENDEHCEEAAADDECFIMHMKAAADAVTPVSQAWQAE